MKVPKQEAEHEAGIVEADETFFLESFKGQRQLARPARVRGGVASKRGISAKQIPVLVVHNRSGHTTDFVLPRLVGQGWRRLLERYRDDISPRMCITEALGRPVLQQVIGT